LPLPLVDVQEAVSGQEYGEWSCARCGGEIANLHAWRTTVTPTEAHDQNSSALPWQLQQRQRRRQQQPRPPPPSPRDYICIHCLPGEKKRSAPQRAHLRLAVRFYPVEQLDAIADACARLVAAAAGAGSAASFSSSASSSFGCSSLDVDEADCPAQATDAACAPGDGGADANAKYLTRLPPVAGAAAATGPEVPALEPALVTNTAAEGARTRRIAAALSHSARAGRSASRSAGPASGAQTRRQAAAASAGAATVTTTTTTAPPPAASRSRRSGAAKKQTQQQQQEQDQCSIASLLIDPLHS